MDIQTDVKATLTKQDLAYLHELVVLGLQRLEEVNKEAWGEKYKLHKDFGNDFLERAGVATKR